MKRFPLNKTCVLLQYIENWYRSLLLKGKYIIYKGTESCKLTESEILAEDLLFPSMVK